MTDTQGDHMPPPPSIDPATLATPDRGTRATGAPAGTRARPTPPPGKPAPPPKPGGRPDLERVRQRLLVESGLDQEDGVFLTGATPGELAEQARVVAAHRWPPLPPPSTPPIR